VKYDKGINLTGVLLLMRVIDIHVAIEKFAILNSDTTL
jgi:hypothetical protein